MNLEDAIRLAATLHAGQTDKQGEPYILHCLRVMLAVPARLRIPALLHDVLEDTPTTYANLRAVGVSEFDALLVLHLTREEDELYHNYIARVGCNPDACAIKVADIRDNLGRIGGLHMVEQMRLRPRYEKALRFLEAAGLA